MKKFLLYKFFSFFSMALLFLPLSLYPQKNTSYLIGSTGPGGGIVFYAQKNYYMEAKELSGQYSWSEAVKKANAYKGGGYSDWRIPTRGELDLIYQDLKKKLSIIGNYRYWSGSPDGDASTKYYWFQDFSNGTLYHNSRLGKNAPYRVFAIRVFINTHSNAPIVSQIGELGAGGGVIFQVMGKDYLEVSPLLGAYTWSKALTAAKNYRGGGFSDWRVPSKEELNLIYQNLKLRGLAGLGKDRYWSFSSLNTKNNLSIWFQDFGDGKQYRGGYGGKESIRPVRAIRTFGAVSLTRIKDGVLTIAEGTEKIKSMMYARNSQISSIVFPTTLKHIGAGAFRENDNLEKLKIPGNIQILDTWSFGLCPRLEEVILEEGVKEIKYRSFYSCGNLKTIRIPESVIYIGDHAIHGNATLVVKPGSYAHQWAEKNKMTFQFYDSDEPEGIKTIVAPLIKTAWKQTGFYRRFIPNNKGVGCWTVALGQILYYHRLNPTGKKQYTSPVAKISVNYDLEKVNFNEVAPFLTESTPEEQIIATARYLFHVGTVFEDKFNNSTGVSGLPYDKRMEKHFSIRAVMHHYPKNTTRKELETLIEKNLSLKRPVMLYVEGSGTGHSLVIDGLRIRNGKKEVHLNFGWQWEWDGWYELFEPLNTPMVNLDSNIRMIMTIEPISSPKRMDS